jgi:DNA-binding NtrC family response regulator
VLSGYEVRAKYSGESALEAALEWQPDVAIIEFILTGMNGLDCANELLELHPDCKVILMYAQVAEYLIDDARARRYEVLAKPIESEEADRHRWRASQRTNSFKVRLLEQMNKSLKLRAQV